MWKSRLLCAALGLLAWPAAAPALEERIEDLAASVEVAGVFELDLDRHAPLAFHDLSPGRETVLGEGRFFNQVTCRSNYGRPWYLKAHLVSLRHTDSGRTLPAANLKWQVVESTGAAEPVGGRRAFQPFSEQPVLLYASHGDDNRGQPVVLQFQYSLSPPPTSLAGTYVGQVVFTMVESP